MSDIHAILFSNESFYIAFAGRNMTMMEDIWAHSLPVSCGHPGWPLIRGRAQVLESWNGIFGNAGGFSIECRHAAAHFAGDAGYVTCYEILDEASLLATNVFVRENGLWKLAHHQAGPAPEPEDEGSSIDEEIEDFPTTVQ